MIDTAPVGVVILELMVPSSAQLPISIYGGLCRHPNIYMGASLRVRGSHYGGSRMTVH